MAPLSPISNQKSQISNLQAWISFCVLCLAWGSTYVGIRMGAQELPPALFSGTRFLTAGIVFGVACVLTGRALPATGRDVGDAAIAGVLLIAGGNGLLTWASRYVTAGVAALVLGAVPLMTASIDAIVPGGKPIRPLGWAGLVAGFGGIVLLIGPDLLARAAGSSVPLALLGLLLAGILWSAGMVYGKRRPPRASLLGTAAVQTAAGGAVLCVIGLLSGELPQFTPTPQGWWVILYLFLVGGIVGFLAYNVLLDAWPAARASTYCYVNPVVAVILGWLVLNEPLEPRKIAAGVVILGGVAVVNLASDESRKKPKEANGS